MKKKNLIVLDIDDTLTSSGVKHSMALLQGILHFGIGITEIDKDWRNYPNATDSDVLRVNYERAFKKPFDIRLIDDFENVMFNYFIQGDATTEIKDASKAINFFINETNYGVCFATGSLYKLAEEKLNQAQINFDSNLLSASNTILTREGIIEDAILKAKKHYKVDDFEHVISFGDALWDVKTAENLGFHFVGVNDKNKEEFKRVGVKHHISDWSELNLNEIETKFNIN